MNNHLLNDLVEPQISHSLDRYPNSDNSPLYRHRIHMSYNHSIMAIKLES